MAKQETPPTLAARLTYVRSLDPEMSMRALSRIAGLSPSVVGLIERGQVTKVESETATKLAKTIGVSLDWLLFGTGKGPAVRATAALLAGHRMRQPPRQKSGPKGRPVLS